MTRPPQLLYIWTLARCKLFSQYLVILDHIFTFLKAYFFSPEDSVGSGLRSVSPERLCAWSNKDSQGYFWPSTRVPNSYSTNSNVKPVPPSGFQGTFFFLSFFFFSCPEPWLSMRSCSVIFLVKVDDFLFFIYPHLGRGPLTVLTLHGRLSVRPSLQLARPHFPLHRQ